MLAGCTGKQTEAEPAAAATTITTAVDTVTVPGVVGLTLDKATVQLEEFGFHAEAVDVVDGKSIMVKKNWQVTTQDPMGGAPLANGSTVPLGVKSLEKLAAEQAAAEKVAADRAAAGQAAAKAAADKAAAEKVAAAQAAADQAARDAAAQQPVHAPAPAAVAPAPAAVYCANCTAAKAAGAAPLYADSPGYGPHLDRDRDGIGCDK